MRWICYARSLRQVAEITSKNDLRNRHNLATNEIGTFLVAAPLTAVNCNGWALFGIALAIVTTQVPFICLGYRFIRIWDVTEYNELFIAFGLLVWTVEFFNRVRSE